MPSKIKRRGKNSWLLTVSCGYKGQRDQNVYTKTIHAETPEEAEKEYTLFKADCLKGKVLTAGADRMTLQEFYDYWKVHHAEKHNELTTVFYNDNLFKRIGVALGHLKIDKIKPRHILNFIDQISQPDASNDDTPLSPNTIRKHFVLLKELFNSAVRWEYITKSPMEKLVAPKREKVYKNILTKDEMVKVMALLSKEKIRYQLWVLLAFSMGLRREEIFGLQWGDINFEESTLSISRAVVYVPKHGMIEKNTKSDNSYRVLAMPQAVKFAFQNWREEVIAAVKRRNKRNKVVKFDDPTGPRRWLFCKRGKDEVAQPDGFNTFLRRFYKDNNLPKISPHLFRHMTGSYLLQSGVDLAKVSKKLGHANKSFTADVYIHTLESAEKQSANVMQNILDDLNKEAKENSKK